MVIKTIYECDHCHKEIENAISIEIDGVQRDFCAECYAEYEEKKQAVDEFLNA